LSLELAHKASGPASSEPAGTAQQASGPATSDKGKLRVFISYSRDDNKFADQLDAALSAWGFECVIDRHGISGGEDWKRRLGEADTVVFVLTPKSARSEICAWEVEEAERLNKRILPILPQPLEGVEPPPRLRDRNYIFFYEELKLPGSGFGTGLVKLVTALNSDFDWLREHTRYLQRAREWDERGRPANRLLSGDDIAEAKAWAAHRPKNAPEPTALHLDFIRASEEEAVVRLSEQRKHLEAVAAAQALHETALQVREEAVKKTARAARVKNIALVAVSILALLAVAGGAASTWSYVRAQQQKQIAEQQKEQADDTMARTLTIIGNERHRMDANSKQEVFRCLGLVRDAGMRLRCATLVGLSTMVLACRRTTPKHASGMRRPPTRAPPAMIDLGLIYEKGHGVPQDYVKARGWYEKAADKGNATAISNLGAFFANGHGVPQDYVKARELYERAAAKDSVGAMVNLGRLYAEGKGVAQDYTKAREWYEKAKDDAEAMFRLGLLYANGDGVVQDYAKAREWWEKAAAKDHTSAMAGLGLLYANGGGVPQDYVKAREWYEKAAAKGDESAKKALE
jgi:TIR domain/Sel1 repeat